MLTLAVLISYMRRTASVICRLFARVSTMKTSVLLSSIFFIADSVVSGYLRMEYWSSGLVLGTDLREYLGLRSSLSVFGRWNFVEYRFATERFLLAPASDLAAFLALSASLDFCEGRGARVGRVNAVTCQRGAVGSVQAPAASQWHRRQRRCGADRSRHSEEASYPAERQTTPTYICSYRYRMYGTVCTVPYRTASTRVGCCTYRILP